MSAASSTPSSIVIQTSVISTSLFDTEEQAARASAIKEISVFNLMDSVTSESKNQAGAGFPLR